MEQVKYYLTTISRDQVIDVLIAIGIIIFIRIFSASISYFIVRMLKIKERKPKRVKDSALYKPLIVVIQITGWYLAFLFIKEGLLISNEIALVVQKGYLAIITIAFGKGLATSFMPNSTLVKKIKDRLDNEVEDSMFQFGLKFVRGLIYIITGFIVITELGINLNGLVAGLGVFSVVITLAAQDTARNLFGGLVIFLDKPFIVGDWIQMTTYEGTVEDITFRSTRLRTSENSLINIPNSVLSSAAIVNWSKMERRRYKLELNVDIETPLDELQKVSDRISKMLKERDVVIDETIMVRFDKISADGIGLLIYTFTNSVDYDSFIEQKEKINYKVMQILRENNIKIV